PAEDCELNASLLSREVPTRLSEAADRPRDVAGELPVVELLQPDIEAGQLVVAHEVRLDVADPAQPALGDAEAPGTDEREGEVARGVVEVRELPVEDADETILVDDEVADAEVAVDDERRTPWRPVLAQPPEPELDRRVRLADLVELLHEPVDRRVLEERQPLRRQRVDLGQLLRHLLRQPIGHGHADDAAPDRLTFEPLHDERLAPLEILDVGDGPRHVHTR